MTIEEIEQEIIDEFSIYDDWMDKYASWDQVWKGWMKHIRPKKI